METINLYAAWIGILLGFLAGVVEGIFFHNDDWRGGYSAWPRRLTRLAHISFFGIAFINLAYAISVRFLGLVEPNPWPSRLFLLGAMTMPLVCYLSAFRKGFRHLFVIPAGSLFAGVIIFLKAGLLP